MSSPRVSIGMPVYNGAQHVAEAIRSLLDQTYGDFELIICDNDSSDGTEEICREFAERDARIRYYRNPGNIGAAANYVRTFTLARGGYFKWAAHDDRCAPEYLQRCVDELESSPASVVLAYPRCTIVDWDGQRIRDYDEELDLREPTPSGRLRHLLRNMHWCHPVLGLIRADVLRGTRLLRPFIGCDDVLLAELTLRGEFHQLPERLFYRRTKEGGSPSLQQPTPEHIEAWFAPLRKDRPAWPHTRMLKECAAAIARAPISRTEKLRCLKALWTGREWMQWSWPHLRREWTRGLRKGTWDRWTVQAVRRSKHFVPHRLWALASGLRKWDRSKLGLAVSRSSPENQEALLRFVADCLSRRADASARQLLVDWARDASEPRRRAAMGALLGVHVGKQ